MWLLPNFSTLLPGHELVNPPFIRHFQWTKDCAERDEAYRCFSVIKYLLSTYYVPGIAKPSFSLPLNWVYVSMEIERHLQTWGFPLHSLKFKTHLLVHWYGMCLCIHFTFSFVCLCVHACVGVGHGSCVEDTGQFAGVSFVLPPCEAGLLAYIFTHQIIFVSPRVLTLVKFCARCWWYRTK